ncbi:VTT domain-containing protein [Candidatus Nomurabacteria bacterium]|nr:VTT domain-containing protein [Candidatus Kaiserbacteria bacterium]MCB9815018.1 VTT domain-containing protein [Candidatus Nomurabacteria bacterium]
MFAAIEHFSEYAPLVIFIASALDIFFVTGLFLYGAAMLSTIAMMHSAGMITVEMIVISAYAGTVFGNTLNYGAGRLFKEAPIVAKRLNHPKVATARSFLQSRGLFIYILICRFIAVARPLYALLLGSLEIKFYRFFIYELIVAIFWIIFWLFILVQGEALFSHFFGK